MGHGAKGFMVCIYHRTIGGQKTKNAYTDHYRGNWRPASTRFSSTLNLCSIYSYFNGELVGVSAQRMSAAKWSLSAAACTMRGHINRRGYVLNVVLALPQPLIYRNLPVWPAYSLPQPSGIQYAHPPNLFSLNARASTAESISAVWGSTAAKSVRMRACARWTVLCSFRLLGCYAKRTRPHRLSLNAFSPVFGLQRQIYFLLQESAAWTTGNKRKKKTMLIPTYNVQRLYITSHAP